jgi:acetyl-CoA synthetase
MPGKKHLPITYPEMDGEVFFPSPEIVRKAYVGNWDELAAEASNDLEGFWGRHARELGWFKKWDKVLDRSNPPLFKWFVGGKVNIVHNCIDRYLHTSHRNKLALIRESEDGKMEQSFSYFALNWEVTRMANVIKAMGVGRGDRVTIYMRRVPEIMFAMLACAKVGAIHSVVFGGF